MAIVFPNRPIRPPFYQASLWNGLVAYWPLSYQNINLATGVAQSLIPGDPNNPAAGVGMPLSSVSGSNLVDTLLGGGIAFDGTNNGLVSQPAIATNAGPLSMTCWINPSSLGATTQLYLSMGVPGPGTGYYLGYRTDQGNTFVFTADGSTTFAKSNVTPSTSTLYFLAGVAYANSAGGIVLFVNGVAQTATGSAWFGAGASNTTTAIASTISNGAKASATIYDCRVYNRALSYGEVAALYQAGIQGITLDPEEGEWPALFVAAAAGTNGLRFNSSLNGLGSSGPFFHDRIAS